MTRWSTDPSDGDRAATGTGREPEGEPGTAAGSDAVYVFAVCLPAPGTAVTAGLTGLPGGQDVRTLRAGELTAVVQTVCAADFAEEAWQARLSDRDELERYARAHHRTVSAVAAGCPTVPLPLATLYHDDERARSALGEQAARFRTVLERTADHAEWGVKVYSEAPAAETASGDDASRSALPAPAADRAAGGPAGRSGRPAPGAGLAYLERKRGMQARREQRQSEALRVAETVDAGFLEVAAAGRRLRTHAPESARDRRVQILNATYLVPRHRAGELAALAGTLGRRTGARIELSGPWVPYSFVGEV
ncbi:gas vesicle protein [Streptomyces nitrosporeus]|uniref:Gas vesicle protein n=1 Tax=Streptomyces nitrosporeus TaxID=28894 RepID=A0A5J6FML0_9ACTN|nr:GvpL/GvpF family gas vesicle protein [Streptomyces nitrosporeus]QEU76205.1 gas vesicle protein [Streptomyces nitrosporeus]GGZ08666.1 gas vesicle protein [Streptomyces nitrosporeus]